MQALVASAPAKINLFLSITGRRQDGFHDLVSLVAPLAWGDTLAFEPGSAPGEIRLECSNPELPVDESNLILKAARAFRKATAWEGSGVFRLEKRIPMGAGLGGGSSNASTALRLLNQASGGLLSEEVLMDLAASIGSDCPLFLAGVPLVMRGRGEVLQRLPEAQCARIAGRRLLVFKPGFGISTPWAYGQMVAGAPGSYLPAPETEARLARWLADERAPLEDLLFNNMEAPAFRKYLSLGAMMELLRSRFALRPLMSGSGSACFAFLPEEMESGPVIACIQKAWGADAFIVETRTASFSPASPDRY